MGREIVVLLIVLLGHCHGQRTGAPTSACDDMLPKQGVSPQDSKPPFHLDITKVKEQHGDVVVVTIKAPEDDSFQGFSLEARLASDKNKLLDGTFAIPELIQTRDCGDGKQNALRRINIVTKENVTSVWTPPYQFEGQVIFRATVARNSSVFWTNIETAPVDVKGPKTTNSSTIPDDYSTCGINQSCFGLPRNCVGNKNCDILLTYVMSNTSVNFEMIAPLKDSNPHWVGVALSDDNKMGHDSVTECLIINDRVIIQESWNTGIRRGNIVLPNTTEGIDEPFTSVVDRFLRCRWKRPIVTTIENVTFDLANSRYYLLLARGNVGNDGLKKKHDDRLASENFVDFTKNTLIHGNLNYLLKIHGSFMVVAWIGLVSIAILIARHYKTVWEEDTMFCKMKAWFACHRIIMTLAVSLMISAFVIIFVHVDGWSQVAPNPHPILGCVCTGLAIIQPFMALCRPSPDAPNRYIFNWLHWFVGNSAQIIAISAIYFATSLSAIKLSDAFLWIVTAFVVFHCLVHAVMQLHSYHTDKKMTNAVHVQDLLTKKQGGKNSPGSGFRKVTLGIYVIVNVGFVIALVSIIFLN